MGVYVYTLRKNTKKISGIEVAQYAYAYKDGWGADDVPVNRRKIAAGERAADAVSTRYYVICSDFAAIRENPSEHQRYFVVKARDQLCGSFSDTTDPKGEIVGYLALDGRKIVMKEI